MNELRQMLSGSKLGFDYALGYGKPGIYYFPDDLWPYLNKNHFYILHLSHSSEHQGISAAFYGWKERGSRR